MLVPNFSFQDNIIFWKFPSWTPLLKLRVQVESNHEILTHGSSGGFYRGQNLKLSQTMLQSILNLSKMENLSLTFPYYCKRGQILFDVDENCLDKFDTVRYNKDSLLYFVLLNVVIYYFHEVKVRLTRLIKRLSQLYRGRNLRSRDIKAKVEEHARVFDVHV